MPNHLKKSAIITFIILFISGILATVVEYKFIETTTEIKRNIIRFHVSWTVLTAIVFGMILEGHARKFWKQIDSKKKILGLLVLVFFGLLVLTSFVLRHVKIQEVHEITKLLHTIFGFVLLLVFVLHKFLKKSELK